jgi:uncharacterized protein YbjT (DUF2867 family)
MSAIKTVALAGASGNLGPAILDALLAAGTFEITVLIREGSKSSFPSGVKVTTVNYDSMESITNALHGQEAVVSTLPLMAFQTQKRMIDAAIAAGVKRFIPSVFGSDLYNPKARVLPVYHDKVAIQDYLAEKSKKTPLTYTPVVNAAFFDWGLQVGLFVNFKEHKASLYDGGDRPFSVTRLSAIGTAVVGALKHPEETENRPLYVHEAVVTQNQLLQIAKLADPSEQWKTEVVSTEKLEKEAYESLAGPDEKRNPGLWYDFLFRAIWGEGYGGVLEKVDNDLLGVKMMSENEIKKLVEGYVQK